MHPSLRAVTLTAVICGLVIATPAAATPISPYAAGTGHAPTPVVAAAHPGTTGQRIGTAPPAPAYRFVPLGTPPGESWHRCMPIDLNDHGDHVVECRDNDRGARPRRRFHVHVGGRWMDLPRTVGGETFEWAEPQRINNNRQMIGRLANDNGVGRDEVTAYWDRGGVAWTKTDPFDCPNNTRQEDGPGPHQTPSPTPLRRRFAGNFFAINESGLGVMGVSCSEYRDFGSAFDVTGKERIDGLSGVLDFTDRGAAVGVGHMKGWRWPWAQAADGTRLPLENGAIDYGGATAISPDGTTVLGYHRTDTNDHDTIDLVQWHSDREPTVLRKAPKDETLWAVRVTDDGTVLAPESLRVGGVWHDLASVIPAGSPLRPGERFFATDRNAQGMISVGIIPAKDWPKRGPWGYPYGTVTGGGILVPITPTPAPTRPQH